MKSCVACGSMLELGNERFCPYCGERLESVQQIDCLLPVTMKYEEVTKIGVIKNPSGVRISRAVLNFYPYYVFDYELMVKRKDPEGKNHKIENRGKNIVNAINGKVESNRSHRGFKGLLHTSFLKINKNTEKDLELPSDEEENRIIEDLKNIEPTYRYAINLTGDYNVNIVDDKVSLKAAEKIIVKKIKIDNTTNVSYTIKKTNDKKEKGAMKIIPTYSDIRIKSGSLVYVPVWVIDFKAGNTSYRRKALAASNTILIDEISLCPKHFSFGKLWTATKQTYAVCEVCGGAYCNDHIIAEDNSYYCEEHRPSKLKIG